jgi:hypothetical protein
MKQPITFISYSRRQLYFAESLALHLQKEGIDVWFDLQQLQAGSVWSEGLKEGVSEAHQMVLVVSKASLESPHTQAEWKGFADKGNRLVLVIYEPVDLPEELRDLPTYDFRGGFNRMLRNLSAFLKGNAESRHDRVPSPNRFGMSATLPGAVWLVLTAHFASLIACMLGLLVAITLGSLDQATYHPFFWYWSAFCLVVGALYAVPFLRHTLEYKKVKQGVWVNLLLLIPTVFAVGQIGGGVPLLSDYPSEITGASHAYRSILGGAAILTLFVYIYLVRRAAGLLCWMQPEETLQSLRRRLHQPLVAKATFDVDIASKCEGKAVTYSIHSDPADSPIVRWVEGIFNKSGHTLVVPGESTQHHIAILSNRSSEAWVQEVTRAYAGKLVFLVVSTIEFKENLAETGRYQWVDARDGDSRDIVGLARSLGEVQAWKREAALETTPAMIDSWKVPSGITVLKRMMELFGIYLLIFGLTDLIGFIMFKLDIIAENGGNEALSTFRVVLGATYFWLSGRALVYRKVAAPVLFGFLGVTFVLATWLLFVPGAEDWKAESISIWTEFWWLVPGVILTMLLYSVLTSWFWLPAFARTKPDEVGIKKSIDRAFKKRQVIIMSAWVIVIVGIALGINAGVI